MKIRFPRYNFLFCRSTNSGSSFTSTNMRISGGLEPKSPGRKKHSTAASISKVTTTANDNNNNHYNTTAAAAAAAITASNTFTSTTNLYNTNSDISNRSNIITNSSYQPSLHSNIPTTSYTPGTLAPASTPVIVESAPVPTPARGPSLSPTSAPVSTDGVKNYIQNTYTQGALNPYTTKIIQSQGLGSLQGNFTTDVEFDSELYDIDNSDREKKRHYLGDSGPFKKLEMYNNEEVLKSVRVDVSTTPNVVRRTRLREAQKISNFEIQNSDFKPDFIKNSKISSSIQSELESISAISTNIPITSIYRTGNPINTIYQNINEVNPQMKVENKVENKAEDDGTKVRGVSSTYWDDYDHATSKSQLQLQPQPQVEDKNEDFYPTQENCSDNKNRTEYENEDDYVSVPFPLLLSGSSIEVSSSPLFSSSSILPVQSSILQSDKMMKTIPYQGIEKINFNNDNYNDNYNESYNDYYHDASSERGINWREKNDENIRERKKEGVLTTERTPFEIPGGVPASLESSILDLADIMQALSAGRSSIKKDKPGSGGRERDREGDRERVRERMRSEGKEKRKEWEEGGNNVGTIQERESDRDRDSYKEKNRVRERDREGERDTERERNRDRERKILYPGSLETSASSSPSSSPPSLGDDIY